MYELQKLAEITDLTSAMINRSTITITAIIVWQSITEVI